MENEETMVEEEGLTEADDTLVDGLVEEEDESEESLDSIMEEGQAAEETPKEEPKGTTEPGYVQKRIAKAVEKAIAETEARLAAQFEAKYAPLQERMLEFDAREMVKAGTVKDLETAKELLLYRQGRAPEQKAEQPRNDQGQYASRETIINSAKTEAKIEMLRNQAEKIEKETGLKVIPFFDKNEDIKQKVISGEMDFYDVAKVMQQNGKKRPPAPMRTPNGVNGQIKGTIMSMTDKQFELLEKRVREGVSFRE